MKFSHRTGLQITATSFTSAIHPNVLVNIMQQVVPD